MDTKEKIEACVAGATLLLAVATFWLALLTRKLEKAWVKASGDQIGVSTWLELERRFDSKDMKRARKKLAEQLKVYSTEKHADISEAVFEFFEDVGTLYRQQCVNRKLADSAFSFYACRWWESAKAYVDHERRVHGEDKTLFEDFEYVAKAMRLPNEVIDQEEVQAFLKDEAAID